MKDLTPFQNTYSLFFTLTFNYRLLFNFSMAFVTFIMMVIWMVLTLIFSAKRVIQTNIITIILIIGLAVPISIGFWALCAHGTVYYIDPSGDDDSSGLSPLEAWQTLGKVNSYFFKPGDKVLFKSDSIWCGSLLIVRQNGTNEKPIHYSSYGKGAKPIIVSATRLPNKISSDPRNGWVKYHNSIYMTRCSWTNQLFINGKRVNRADNPFSMLSNEFYYSNGMVYVKISDPNTLLFSDLRFASEDSGIIINKTCYVHVNHINTWGSKGTGTGFGQIVIKDSHNIDITNCDIHGCPGYGIIIDGSERIIVDSNNVYDVGLTGIGTGSKGKPSREVTISNNKIWQVGYLLMDNYHDAHGIGVGNLPGNSYFYILRNRIYQCGRAGGKEGNVHTGEAITCWETNNVIIKSNYIYDNYHGGIALELGGRMTGINHLVENNVVCRNGLIKKDGTKYGANYSGIALIRFRGPYLVANIKIIGNLIYDNYVGWEGASSAALYITAANGSEIKEVEVKNNTVHNNGLTNYEFWVRPGNKSNIEMYVSNNTFYRVSKTDYLRVGRHKYPHSRSFSKFKLDTKCSNCLNKPDDIKLSIKKLLQN